MMATLETKYSIGDVVYFASTIIERRHHDCPDCLGSREWKAVSPAGAEYSFACPRCAGGYMSNNELSLSYSAHSPIASKLTIGSVRYDSTEECASYMCCETGVGSGSVYREKDLFPTEEAALEAAKIKAEEANSKTLWIVEKYNKALAISDYQLHTAEMKLAREEMRRVGSMFFNVGYLFSEIEEASDKEAILELIDFYKKHDWENDAEGFSVALRNNAT